MLNDIYIHDYSYRIHQADHNIDAFNLIPRSELNLKPLNINELKVGQLIDLELPPQISSYVQHFAPSLRLFVGFVRWVNFILCWK